MSLFDLPPAADIRYQRLFNPEYDQEKWAHDTSEAMWAVAQPFLDRDVVRRAPVDFLAAFWEIYLAASLVEAGVELVPTVARDLSQGGPDLMIASPHCFVEAIAATAGKGPNEVTEAVPFVVRSVPEAAITLRFAAAVAEKHRKYATYVRKGVLSADDPYVIAINGARVPSTRGEPSPPWIARTVLPFGRYTVVVDVDTLDVVDGYHAYEPTLTNANNAAVPKDVFLQTHYSGISALLYCWADESNNRNNAYPPLHATGDFIVLHNPLARNPMPIGSIPCGMEYWAESNELKSQPGRR